MQPSLIPFFKLFYKYALFCLWVNCTTYFMFNSLQICSNKYLFNFKVKCFKNSMGPQGLFSFNMASEQRFSVNLARSSYKAAGPYFKLKKKQFLKLVFVMCLYYAYPWSWVWQRSTKYGDFFDLQFSFLLNTSDLETLLLLLKFITFLATEFL